ncbi:MAG: DUF1847 domain-containing protein [Parasporobacterium sp.]|nr:DUF1847 domain-containing protein [Parasporobacterium sp.]
MNLNKEQLGCADCRAKACQSMKGNYPAFCPGQDLPEEVLSAAMKEYEDPQIRRVTIAAAETESENYCRMTRAEETMEFARKIGAKRIGIAHCVGLLEESGIMAKILRKNGFEVISISCKCGEQKKADVGISPACHNTGVNMCNPILQAKYLNSRKTDLNVLIGLCVGHDSLFYKYSEALVTTLVSKDRVLAHNPVGALYQADKYLHLI